MSQLKLKSGILLGALLLGGGAAGASSLAKALRTAESENQTLYNWETPGGATLEEATVEAARNEFNCTDGTNICATGTPVGGGNPIQLRKP